MSAFNPRWKHVTQWGSGGDPNTGSNNCAEASCSRAIMEYDPNTSPRKSNSEWDLVRRIHDPKDPASILDLIDRVSLLGRGQPNGPWNGFTSADGIQHILDSFGIRWSVSYTDAVGSASVTNTVQQSALALCWVDGTALAPSSYSGDFFGGDWGWDHIILSLPDGNLFNDPLSDVPDRKTDVRYAWDALQGAIGGVWALQTPEGISSIRYTSRAAALKVQPNHICRKLADLTAGASVTLTGAATPHWSQVRYGTTLGWLLTDNLK